MKFSSASLGVLTLLAPLTVLAADPPVVAPPAPPAKEATPPVPVEPPKAVEAPPEPVKKPADIDAAAVAIVKQASAAYKALNTFATNMEVKVERTPGTGQLMTYNLVYQRPGLALMKATDDKGTRTFASEGQTLFVSIPTIKDRYLKKQMPPQAKPADIVLGQATGAGPGIGAWLSGEDVLASVLPAVSSMKVGKPATAADADLDTVVLLIESPRGVTRFSMSFAKGDHLLRVLTMEQSGKNREGVDQKVVVTETHTNVQPNAALTPGTLKFVPPAGAMASEDLDEPMRDPRLKVGTVPFPINAKDHGGKPVSLAQYKGKVLLIDFWASWCPPCMRDMPNVLAAHKKYRAQGFEILGISLDESHEKMDECIKKNKMTWRQIFDGKVYDGAIPMLYGIKGVPNQILLGRDGKIAALDFEHGGLDAAVKKAIGKVAAVPVAKAKGK